MDSVHKFTRVLYMYTEMCEGRAINKKEASLRFGVDERSIQRDIDVYSDRCIPLARCFRASLTEGENHLHGD